MTINYYYIRYRKNQQYHYNYFDNIQDVISIKTKKKNRNYRIFLKIIVLLTDTNRLNLLLTYRNRKNKIIFHNS